MRKNTILPLSFVLCSAALIAGCSTDGWKKMSIDGATVSFEMPEPIKQVEDQGMVMYLAQKPEQKLSFRVGILKRDFEKDQQQGLTDEKVVTAFAQRVIQANQQQFAQMKMPANFQFNGAFPVENGQGLQFQAQVGKALVLDRFYVNKVGLYYVEVTTQDPKNADANRFLNSFHP
ncbi:hypothetical protein KF707_12650 [Candidatus Obscuribacterales bacterium]|jgi:hypothetical protein|nr:hypothetical protein [Candidatus Obscuribacterales bacterium]MBX3137084.1 hypothetical protein [Candidatus Obscuribacterales bacterium]MBX3151277.1 hypothetical protein [Candidatus Obscuribacterales bacterium]